MTANTYDNERETLSALFDGELNGDAARFALKRLGHDQQWRDAFGRWQLCGDVLRGQATAVANGDFAQRVASAIAHEPTAAQSMPKATLFSGRRGWIGGALAASVAVAALFVARPLSNGSAPVAPDAAQAQVAEASSALTNAGPEAPVTKTPLVPDPAVDLGTAAVAAAEVPRRAIERRSVRSQNQRAALRASARREPAAVAVAAAVAPAPATTALAGDVLTTTANAAASANPNPFQPQPSEAAARPWPRAVLPQYSTEGGINASYGAASPSFYPFEPSMPQEAAQTTSGRDSPPH